MIKKIILKKYSCSIKDKIIRKKKIGMDENKKLNKYLLGNRMLSQINHLGKR